MERSFLQYCRHYGGRRAIVLAISAVLLASCATKAGRGAMLGGLAGGLACAVSKNKDCHIWVLAGGGIGYLFGRHLDEKDLAALEPAIHQTASQTPSGQTEVAVLPSGIRVSMTPKGSRTTVKSPSELGAIPEASSAGNSIVRVVGRRIATADVNVRTGPGINYPSKFVLRRGQTVELMGPETEVWILVGDEGRAVGYVNSQYLRDPSKSKLATPSRKQPEPSPVRGSGAESGSAHSIRPDGELAAPGRSASSESDVRATWICRDVLVRFRHTDGAITEETVESCRQSDGSVGQ